MTTDTTYNPTIIGQQMLKLTEYLKIPPNIMLTRCGIRSSDIIQKYIDGKHTPTLTTINKILKQYPVEPNWLLRNKGIMWKEDYFEKRFREYSGKHETPEQKLRAILEIYGVSLSQISRDTSIHMITLRKILNGTTQKISPTLTKKFSAAYPYIPMEWWKTP